MLGTRVPSLLSYPYFLCHEWILAELQGAFWDPYCHEALALRTSFLAIPFPLLAGEPAWWFISEPSREPCLAEADWLVRMVEWHVMRCTCGSNYVKAFTNSCSFSLGKYSLWDQLLSSRWQSVSLPEFSFSPITQNSVCSRGFEMPDIWINYLISLSFNVNESHCVVGYTIKNLFICSRSPKV